MKCHLLRRTLAWVVLVLPIAAASDAFADSLFSYNVVVTGTLSESSHVDGRTFVNNLSVSNQPNFAQVVAAGTGDTLDVAGSVTGSGLTLGRGTFRHAGSLPSPFTLNLNNGATQTQDPTVNIGPLSNQMSAAAAYYDTLSGTPVSPSGNSISFNASGSGVAVFSTSAASLQNQNENVSVNVGTASAVIIKVTGSSFALGSSEHESITGSGQKVLWYFPTATTINLADSTWNGSILATGAALSAPNQTINGGIYVGGFTQSADVHLSDSSLAVGQPMFSGPAAAPLTTPMRGGVALIGLLGISRLRSHLRKTQIRST